MRAPSFWQDDSTELARLLAPLGWLYAETTAWRLAHSHPWRAPVPVICVGNLTAGGSGKTPVVRDLAARLTRQGLRPHILSRGYGGCENGPLRVDPDTHGAADVGDEPLLLARDAPCWISADRAEGARAIVATGGGAILMDDGLQNSSLAQDLKLIVVDGEAGFGNGRPIPAGPLRERIAAGLARADAVAILGADTRNVSATIGDRLPILRAYLEPRGVDWLKGAKVVGFAGIGRPQKFAATLSQAGAETVAFHAFADHHPYREGELTDLIRAARTENAILATTEKDWFRLSPLWRERVRAVPVALRWDDEAAIASLLDRIATGV